MWLDKSEAGMDALFSEDVVYIESWGPEYHGLALVKHWFREWNARADVLQWDIKQFFHKDGQTVVEWYFRNASHGGKAEAFEGMSLIKWTPDGKIRFLQEFGCNENRYDPYAQGPEPRFRDETAIWF